MHKATLSNINSEITLLKTINPCKTNATSAASGGRRNMSPLWENAMATGVEEIDDDHRRIA
ncbi:MAG: hypothetical protein WCJ64_25125, partial [Rhodospirillaceae bacterium]